MYAIISQNGLVFKLCSMTMKRLIHKLLQVHILSIIILWTASVVSMITSRDVDHGFEPRSGQTKDYKIGIFCFSAKHAALRRKSKDWLARNKDNVSEWGDMSINRLLFQWASTIKIQLSVLVYYKPDLIIRVCVIFF
jgi:hypothetical protein